MGRSQGSSRQRVPRPDLKKRRPPVACIPCYRRKVKCGREVPVCRRCVQSGHEHECHYRNSSPANLPQSSLPQPGDAIPVALPRHVEGPQPDGRDQSAQAFAQETSGPPQTISSRGMIHFKGRATSTRFYGFSYHLNLYQRFAHLPRYISQVKAQYPLINQLRDDIFVKLSRKPANGHSNQSQVDTQSLVNLVPQQEVVDVLVQAYLDYVEVTHRVLHIPSFYRQYNRYWETSEETSENFLVQLCLIMAIASATRHEAATLVASPEPIEMAKKWIQAAEIWLNSQHTTSVESLPSLQTQCLLLIAKRANYIHETGLWASTGTLIRWAMAAGYHREVGPEAPISPFHREMRRRLWATITELDLLAAMERGMPPSIRQDEFNTRAPANENEEVLTPSSTQEVTSQPLCSWTSSSFQVLLRQSYATRSEICAMVNGCQNNAEMDRILAFADSLTQSLQKVPGWSKSHVGTPKHSVMVHLEILLSIILNQYLLLVHVPAAIQTPPTATSAVCRRARLDTAVMILSQYRSLNQQRLVTETACRVGLLFAAMNLCHELYLGFNDSSSSIISSMPELVEPFISLVEHAWRIVERRVTSTLEGVSDYYVLSMIIGLVKSLYIPTSSATWAKDVGEKVVRVSRVVHDALHRCPTTPINQASEPNSTAARDHDADFFHTLTQIPDDMDFLLHDFNFGSFVEGPDTEASHVPLFSWNA
ncbi:Zn(2)-Cys(6) zinc finger domain protein [Metarhizium robertsii]|uniref:Zn(2)-Cys(6) zinc finger domain protein n=1 Tax=Metarhizium robertsii TaxID=568076 RepID=A0A014P841_9HYPO|nr:Zn(2)-Cys(6) zinc finger domain protein [Metarhizium robertsii]